MHQTKNQQLVTAVEDVELRHKHLSWIPKRYKLSKNSTFLTNNICSIL